MKKVEEEEGALCCAVSDEKASPMFNICSFALLYLISIRKNRQKLIVFLCLSVCPLHAIPSHAPLI